MNTFKDNVDADLAYLKTLTVLYVEDEDEVRDQLKTFLQRRCQKVFTAANGKKGLEAFKKHSPSIVITDILMPIMDGLKMAEYIQEISPHVPILIITAFEEPRYFHRAIELNVQQYVNKPVKLDALEQALQKSARSIRAESALKEVNERYRLLFKLSNIAISVADANHGCHHLVIEKNNISQCMEGKIVDCNEAFLQLIGYQNLALLTEQEHNFFSIMTDESIRLFKQYVKNELLVRGFSSEFELELIGSNKNIIPVIAQLILRYSETGEPMEIWVVMRDIRERRKVEEKLRLSAKVFECSKDAIIISDQDNQIISVNHAFSEITGYQLSEVLGKNPSLLQSGRHDKEFYQQLWNVLKLKGYWQGEIWNRRKSGEIFPEWLTISQVHDHNNAVSHYIAIFSDISEAKSSEAHIEFLANYDPLTQLPNRRLFIDRLEQAIKTAAREKTMLAVLFFDLDHFKIINDSLGHSIGDEMLVEVAKRISECMREIDSVSRLSGDEFAAIIADVHDVNHVITLVEKIIFQMRKVFRIKDYELHITVSVGISIYPNDGINYEMLLKNSDTAMYHAKKNGRDNFEFYSNAMSAQALERLSLESSLRKAMENQDLKLYYQPQVNVDSGKIIGMEALLRWPHQDLGLIPPDKFIPLAEETGMIIALGKWVLEEACRQNKAWQEKGLSPVPVAVNLSAVQFRQHNFLEVVHEVLLETGLRASFLELELTEGILMDCSELNVKLLREFRRLGVKLAIDDFGTGYSSLSYLKRFPIHKLKIDRSFSQDIPNDANNAAITSAIISLGHELGLCVIAEGVETETQLNYLQAQQCDEIQGYYFSQAVPADEMEALLKQGRFRV